LRYALSTIYKREPDFVVGGRQAPYMLRWWVLPRNRFFNVYVHMFLRDDDDRALHDHPWASLSLLCRGTLTEVTHDSIKTILAGEWSFRSATLAHRLVVPPQKECPITLFITGPRVREWGFHCPKGWKPWMEFCGIGDKGTVGAGCGEEDL